MGEDSARGVVCYDSRGKGELSSSAKLRWEGGGKWWRCETAGGEGKQYRNEDGKKTILSLKGKIGEKIGRGEGTCAVPKAKRGDDVKCRSSKGDTDTHDLSIRIRCGEG